MSTERPYLVPAAPSRAEIRERGSRFLALVLPATDEEEAKARVDEVAADHPDATHVCFAWRVGRPARERASDAGEPAGTAGRPILRALEASDVSDVVAAVVRWFGGTKLGKGGLARAYAAATRAALLELRLARRVPRVRIELEVEHDRVGAVKRALRPPAVELIDERYGERAVLVLAATHDALPALANELAPLGLDVPGLDDATPETSP